MGRLTATGCNSAAPGKHPDGDGLSLIVGENGARRWEFRFQLQGRRRVMGLGSYPEITLAAARIAATAARTQIAGGTDPIDARAAARKAALPLPTFGQIAATVISEKQKQTTSKYTRARWERLLGPRYVAQLLNRPVNEITPSDVAKVLQPVWADKPGVAEKLRPTLYAVFEKARIVLRDEHGVAFSNPAAWSDFAAMGWKRPQTLKRGHFASLPYNRMCEFMAALRERDGMAARLLEFCILTGTRLGTVRQARWSEIDIDNALWVVPLAHLKDRAHRKTPFRIPLSPRALQILDDVTKIRANDKSDALVFPGVRGGEIGEQATTKLLLRMDPKGAIWLDGDGVRRITGHGFRASFKTWASEATPYKDSLVELCLGHTPGNLVERSYIRTDMLDARRAVMDAWSAHCDPAMQNSNVLPFASKGA
jgi:integrase